LAGGLVTLGGVVTFPRTGSFDNTRQMRFVATNESLFFGVVVGFNSVTVPKRMIFLSEAFF